MAANVNWDSLIKAAVNEGIKQVAEKKTNDLAAKDVPAATNTVADKVKEQLKPVIENQTNSEPWYKSRVTRGAIGVLLTTAFTAFMDWYTDGVVESAVLGGYLTTAGSALYTIYGRWTSAGTPTV